MLKSAGAGPTCPGGAGSQCRLRWGFLLVLLLSLAMLGACMPRLGDSEAALALEDISAGWLGSRLKSLTPGPERRSVVYAVDDRQRNADLYLSLQGAQAGIVLVPGVTPQGKDDSRLVALANTLARLRFAVLVPDLRGVRRYRVSASDVEEVADAFRYLRSRPELAPGDRAGIAGISYGAGPVVLAALEPGVREEVDFVVTLGGYYDLHSTVTYITTGYYRVDTDRPWQRLDPHPYARSVFLRSYAELVERRADRGVLSAYARDLMGDIDIVPLVTPRGLAPDARALYDLVTNRNPDRVPELIDRLSPRIRRQLEALNPAAHDVSEFPGRFILVHGRSDNLIPYTESVALHRALPSGRSDLFVIDGFAHVDLSLKPQDVQPMLRAMELVLSQRGDHGQPPVPAHGELLERPTWPGPLQ